VHVNSSSFNQDLCGLGCESKSVRFNRNSPELEWLADKPGGSDDGNDIDQGVLGLSQPRVFTNRVNCDQGAFGGGESDHVGTAIQFELDSRSIAVRFDVKANCDRSTRFEIITHAPDCVITKCSVAILKRINYTAEIVIVPTAIGLPARKRFSFEQHSHEPRPLLNDSSNRAASAKKIRPSRSSRATTGATGHEPA
jgi:hypothetical protein